MGGKAKNPTPNRNVRVEDELWEQFGQAVAALGTDRSTWLRDAIAWCVRQPGARLPKRPAQP